MKIVHNPKVLTHYIRIELHFQVDFQRYNPLDGTWHKKHVLQIHNSSYLRSLSFEREKVNVCMYVTEWERERQNEKSANITWYGSRECVCFFRLSNIVPPLFSFRSKCLCILRNITLITDFKSIIWILNIILKKTPLLLLFPMAGLGVNKNAQSSIIGCIKTLTSNKIK